MFFLGCIVIFLKIQVYSAQDYDEFIVYVCHIMTVFIVCTGIYIITIFTMHCF